MSTGSRSTTAKPKRQRRKPARTDPVMTMYLAGASIELDTSPMLPSDAEFRDEFAGDLLGLDSPPADSPEGVFGGYKKGEGKP